MKLPSTRAVSQSDTDKSSEALLVADADLKRSNAAIAESAGQIVIAEKSLLYRQEQLAFTSVGIGMLLMIVMGMGGIYRGLIYDATLLIDHIGADLWIVQGSTRGPFAEVSRIPANLEDRTRSVPGVAGARRFISHIRDATLSIARGEIVGMFGPSGSGKSTLLTAMALINPPTSGQISIGGKPVLDGPKALVDLRAFRRQHLGFVFQKANLIPFLTALENVQIALEVNETAPKAARKRAMELLDYLSIGTRADNLPVALSGGEQQRVAVARALANEPNLILADEPTASLDSRLGQQVMELFAKIAHEKNAGVIVVTHDHRTLDVFDRILDVEDGMIQVRAASLTPSS